MIRYGIGKNPIRTEGTALSPSRISEPPRWPSDLQSEGCLRLLPSAFRAKLPVVQASPSYSIAVGTTDQLNDVTPGSIERRNAILSTRSFRLP